MKMDWGKNVGWRLYDDEGLPINSPWVSSHAYDLEYTGRVFFHLERHDVVDHGWVIFPDETAESLMASQKRQV